MNTVTLDLYDVFEVYLEDIQIAPKDRAYILKRLHAEGITFCTKTLPLLAKSVLHSLEKGYFVRPTNFAWKGRSLLLFNSLLVRIFDNAGRVRVDACAESIYLLRTACDYFYKLAFSFSDEEIDAACEGFKRTEREIPTAPFPNDVLNHVEGMRANFETYFSELANVHMHEILEEARPRCGPGSFAKHSATVRMPYYVEKNVGANKTPTAYAPYSGYLKDYPRSKEPVCFIPNERKVSEVLFVPKDSRGPRVIAREPQFNLKVQMSYFDYVSKQLERLSKYRINFADQTMNQKLALKGSLDRNSVSTIDLKEGSDRVSFDIVKQLFKNSHGLLNLILSTRSNTAVLPTGEEIRLSKLAGMGSGLTFPTMALVIYLSISTYVAKRRNVRFNDVAQCVYVYGDDIIVPTHMYQESIEALNLIGLKVNQDKSYVHSHFRESCGADFYKGVDVTPLRLRLSSADLPSPTRHICLGDSGILQLERHCRELKKFGFWTTANYYYDKIEAALGKLPYVANNSHVLGRYMISDTLIKCTDTKTVSWVAKTITKESFMHSNKKLSVRLRPTEKSDLELLFDQQPLKDLSLVDVPREIRLRKRQIYDTAFYGM